MTKKVKMGKKKDFLPMRDMKSKVQSFFFLLNCFGEVLSRRKKKKLLKVDPK